MNRLWIITLTITIPITGYTSYIVGKRHAQTQPSQQAHTEQSTPKITQAQHPSNKAPAQNPLPPQDPPPKPAQASNYQLQISEHNIHNREGWHEADWRDALARNFGGKTEVSMPDRTRCDIVTETHAIEVDWGRKWHEGVGQSLWYSLQTGLPAGLVLIADTEADERALLRASSTVQAHQLPIRIWIVR